MCIHTCTCKKSILCIYKIWIYSVYVCSYVCTCKCKWATFGSHWLGSLANHSIIHRTYTSHSCMVWKVFTTQSEWMKQCIRQPETMYHVSQNQSSSPLSPHLSLTWECLSWCITPCSSFAWLWILYKWNKIVSACVSYFSWCCNQISSKEQLQGGMLGLSSQFLGLHIPAW